MKVAKLLAFCLMFLKCVKAGSLENRILFRLPVFSWNDKLLFGCLLCLPCYAMLADVVATIETAWKCKYLTLLLRYENIARIFRDFNDFNGSRSKIMRFMVFEVQRAFGGRGEADLEGLLDWIYHPTKSIKISGIE